MFAWLRKFFYSDDPVVQVAGGLTEPEAGMLRNMLEEEGVPAFVKNMSGLSYYWGNASLPNPYHYAIFTRRSDAERAQELLAPLVREAQLTHEWRYEA